MRTHPIPVRAGILVLATLLTTGASLWAQVGATAPLQRRPGAKLRLSINPADLAQIPNSVTLTAQVTQTGLPTVKQPPLPESGFRYTFRAQRWPCGESYTIATNSQSPTVGWVPPKAGIYTFTVEARHLGGGRPRTHAIQITDLGSAEQQYYRVKPQQSGFGHNWVSSVSPPSGTPPVIVTVSGNLTNPVEFRRWVFKFFCAPATACDPKEGWVDSGQFMSAAWNTKVLQGGQTTIYVDFHKLRPSDCELLEWGFAHDFWPPSTQ